MAEPIDFEKLIANVTESRGFLDEAAATMTGETKKNFDTLLGAIDHHFEQVKVEVPKCQQMFLDKFDDLQQRHEKNIADLAVAKENFEQAKQQIADGNIPIPEAPEGKAVDTQLGNQLRDELLSKFLPEKHQAPSTSGVAWQDWNMDGGWMANNTTDT